ncbi:MAG TPA: hypothetical protein VGR07_04245 [Thermoanaerobaculia bacterium]|jgi:hypothetical protein|nr:hypothetical protein [Thermoanaerobaculia bacterium]
MDQSELLRQTTRVLEKLGLRYFVTGSVATIFYGEPRFTNDIDIVLDLPPGRVADLCAAFPSDDFYVSEEAARKAVARRGQFNILHPASGLKLDLMIPAEDAFNRSRFARIRRLRPAPDYDAAFASAEDVILKKMEYYREGGSEKHLRDIAGVLKISGEAVDREYIKEWATKLGLEEIWQTVARRSEEERYPRR